ncbi:MAG: ABC transporter substrate-binding protein [Deltaproteobacteria bacterium]|nr:ABC transporter substrate-binding protein [Deltaproteobacteria bacterium]MBN2673218.1 ABC transporter substrate-binding protein [Deltaproteobacteria bacterium]
MRKVLQYAVFFSVLIISGCPAEIETPIQSPSVQQTASPEAEKGFRDAVRAFNEQRYEDAEAQFETFLAEFPDDPLVGQVQVYQGRIAMEQKQFSIAKSFFTRVVELGNDHPSYDYARMHLGLCEYELHSFEKAIEILSPYAGRFANAEENRNILSTLVKCSAAVDDWKEEIRWTEQLLLTGPSQDVEKERLQRVSDLVASQTETSLHKAAAMLTEKGTVWALVTAQIARIQFESEQFDKATDTIADIQESGTKNAESVSELIALIEKRNSVDIRTIGCMLPLSGKMRLVGQDTLKGVMLASKRNRFGRENAPLSVVMRDTATGTKTPEEIVEELVMKERVAAIIGPMDAKWSTRAAQKAQRLGVPMLLLSADEQAAGQGNYVFRKFASHHAELSALMQYAAESSDPPVQYAVLYPENSYGTLMVKLMSAELKNQGTTAVTVGFDPALADFGQVAEKLAAHAFSVLLLPMTADQLALAAPALAAAGIWPTVPGSESAVHVATYLVPSAGYSPTLVSRAGRYLQNAVFVSDFKTDRSPSVLSFTRNFENEYKASPSTFAAYGYDATLLVSNAISAGVSSRRELRTWLDEVLTSDGLVFPFSGFNENGEAIASPRVLRLEEKALVDK